MPFLPKAIFIVLTSILTLAMGVFVLKQRRTSTNVAFFFLCLTAVFLCTNILMMEWYVENDRVPLPWHNIYDVSSALFLLSSVFFAIMFPVPLKNARRIWLPFSVAGLVVSLFSILGANFSEHIVVNRSHTFKPTVFFYIFNVYGLSALGTMVGILFYKYRSSNFAPNNQRAKSALRTVLIWFVIGTVFGLFFSFVRVAFYFDMTQFYMLTAGFAVGTAAIFYSIVRYNAFDIETVLHKTLSWFILSSGPAVVIFGAALWLKPSLQNASDWQWAATVGGISCLAGFYLYFAQPYIDQLFDRRRYDLAKATDEVIRDLAVLQELRSMASRIVERLCQVLTVQGGAAMVLDDERKHMIVVARNESEISDSNALGETILRTFEMGPIVELDQTQDEADTDTPHLAWLRAHSFALCIPLVQKGELVGVLAFGRKRNLRRFSPRELAFLSKIGAAVTIAFSNSLLLERVRELDRSKTEFLSEVAHELRGPLSGMASIAEGVLTRNTDQMNVDQKRMVENIRITADEMKNLVDHLLDLSKIEMGVMRYEFQPVDIGSCVRLALDLVTAELASKGLDVQVEIDDDLPMIRADKARIRQCFSNLISNAIKYTDRGKLRISCTRDGDLVKIAVEDTGRGMTPEEKETIFDRFRRGKRVEGIEGSGLGLTVTKEIIEAQGGTIDVESTVGVGSVFSIYLPINNDKETDQSASRAGRVQLYLKNTRQHSQKDDNGAITEIIKGRGEKVLVVDDSEAERSVIYSYLEANGYRIETASNGHEAFESARVKKPDLIITDLMMPLLSGPEFCRMLKSDPDFASIPIIMLTGRNNLGDMVFGIQMGADDYIAKPCNLQELLLRVAALLRMQRIRNDLDSARSRLAEMELIATSSGTLVHAIKNPLVKIQNYVKYVKAGLKGMNYAKTSEGLDQIYSSADAISRILQGLKRAHLDPPKMTTVSLPELLDGCEREILSSYTSAKYEVRKRYDVNIPIEGDQHQLRMAFTNLLVNALEAMPDGGPITINIYDVSGGIGVDITDSGFGIQAEIQGNIFKPFFTTKSGGTGLGLWTAKRIIEFNHGGRLTIESRTGEGTTAKVWIPAARRQRQVRSEVVQNG